jgi:hypothetical protein
MCSDKSSTNQRADYDVVSPRGPTIFIADPHRGDGKRFVVRADERLTAFYRNLKRRFGAFAKFNYTVVRSANAAGLFTWPWNEDSLRNFGF